jgi:single-strand DNA-binding protein
MNDLNTVVLVGRLTRDAELSFIPSGTAVCKFAIANNQSKKKDDKWTDEAHFFDVTLWGKTGEALAQYLKKGKQVAIEGRLTQDRWTDTDGKARSRVQIVASAVQLLGSSKQDGKQEPQREPGQDNEPSKPEPGTDEIPF